MAPNLQVDRLALQQAAQELVERPSSNPVMLEVLAQQDSETADPVLVKLRANVLSGS